MLYRSLAVTFLSFAAAQHEHAHGHGRELCGCAQFEADHPFTIDCSAAGAANIRAATATLTNDCGVASSATCSAADANGVMACQAAFFVLQSHHDYCDHDTLTRDEEELVHVWENFCLQCGIERQYEPSQLACPRVNCQDTSVIDAAYWILNTTCTPAAGDGHAHRRLSVDERRTLISAERQMRALSGERRLSSHAHDHGSGEAMTYEWAGVFPVADASHTFILQKVGTPLAYPDATMTIVVLPATAVTQAGLEALIPEAAHGFAETCTVVSPGGSITPVTDACFTLDLTGASESRFTIVTTGLTGLAMFAQHFPIEFERDTHYFADSAGADVEPAGEIPDPAGSCCNTAAQIGAFKQVVAYHDLCDHDDVPTYVEVGLHDYEAACAAHFCNAVLPGYDGTVCPSPPPPPTAPEPDTMAMGAVIGIIVAAAVVIFLAVLCIVMLICKEKAGKPVFTNLATPSGGSA